LRATPLVLAALPSQPQFAQMLQLIISQIKPLAGARPASKFQQLASKPLGVVRLKD